MEQEHTELEHLQLLSLEAIEITLSTWSKPVVMTWQMPSLCQGTLVLTVSGGHEFEWFLEKHGRQVNELQIHNIFQEVIDLGKACPNLDHLVLNFRNITWQCHWESTAIVLHPTLKWIDVCMERRPQTARGAEETMISHSQKTSPALQGIRLWITA
ncbi:hypothetical protein BKA70DRAFT_485003 [Coprinopsis sp. MPI-PUGE-AT-0042]|nr:hypothetical protein BKA70DRAFT_485003 [Coprinopsis sp. MPI-PUGE-AT-0042]